MDEPEIPDPYCNPDKPIAITFDEITSAAYRIKSGIRNTECTYSEHLSNLTGMEIYVKKEFLQATGSFKERGARYAMMMLPPEKKAKGIVAASSGNHAQACCYHGNLLGIPVTVFMPEVAPIMKIQKCRDYKGDVKVQGKNLGESKKLALAYARDNGMMYLNGYDHPKVLAGQGTIGLEVWEQVPNLEAVIAPVGGGGLVAGVCNAIKALDKNIHVIGVEPVRAACLTAALKTGAPVGVEVGNTLADGLAVGKIGVNSFESIKQILDKCVAVEEEYIALAILKLVESEKSVVEGAGATPLAAILQGSLPEYTGKRVCLILSGGNMDTTVLGRVLDRGMAADGRLVKVKVCISDRVGGIEELVTAIGSIGVHIKDIVHERAWVTQDVFSVEVKVICESTGRQHSLQLRDFLAEKFGRVVFNGTDYPDNATKKSHIFAPLQTHNKIPATSSDEDKPSVQQQIIDFESLPKTIVKKESPVVASIQTVPKRPSQQDGTQTGQGEVLMPIVRSPRASKQSTGSIGSSQQDRSSQQPERISQQKPADPSTQPVNSSHSAGKTGGSQTAAETLQVPKKSSIQGEPILTPEKILQQKPLESAPHPSSLSPPAGKPGGSQTATGSVQISKKSSIQADPMLSEQKQGESLPPPSSSLHSAGKSGGSQTATGSVQVSKKNSIQPDAIVSAEKMNPQKPVESLPSPASSSHSAVKSAGSQTVTESVLVSKKSPIHAEPKTSTQPIKSGEGNQSSRVSEHSPQVVKQTATAPLGPFSNCNCKKRGAPGDYQSKT